MEKISQSVTKKDHSAKIRGEAIYVADYPTEGVLIGKMLRSSKARAKIIEIKLPELPEGYIVVDKNDVPGDNNVNIVMDDTPVFARDTVEFIGDPILMVVGEDQKVVDDISSKIRVVYEEQIPLLDVRDFNTVFFDYNYSNGNVDSAFAEADFVFEEQFETGFQEQAYLETQGMIAEPHDGRMTVHGSMQCPYYVHGALARALGYRPDQVQVKQDVTGGGFGGKEAYPSILACQTAVAAYKAQKPVRVVFDRREDMEFTSKRHPSLSTYKLAVKDGKVTAMDIDVLFNGGAFTTLSAVVLQRGIICASGAYNIPNLRVRGRAVKTNTTPSGAYRGFGAPQTFFAVELMMNHVARQIGVDELEFKSAHVVKKGDRTSTGGQYHFPVPLPDMLDEIDAACDLRRKFEEYKKPQSGRYRRGMGMSWCFHGAGFTGSGERDHIKAVVNIKKYKDGTVEVLASNADIGQGIKTTFCKIVAAELGLPLEKVKIENPDTDRTPDSGPTVASRSLMIVGELLRRAAIKLKLDWHEGQEQLVEERYREPTFLIPFDLSKFAGDAYPTYGWGVIAVEVEVDTLTGLSRIIGAWGNFDVGTPIDYNIVLGQMEGGLLQGLGYASIEIMTADNKGRIRNNSFSDYIIPTAMDVTKLIAMLHVDKYPDGPYGAKGAGELPLVSAAPAYVSAMEQALGGALLHHIPFTAEDTIRFLMMGDEVK